MRDALPGALSPLLLDARAYVLPSPRLPAHPAATAYAAPSFPPGRPLVDAAIDLSARIHRDFRYASGSSDVGSTVGELLERGEGVCQDFAHLAVAGLRAMGLAARYVSGYPETRPPPGQDRLVGADASHAWFSACTPRAGWTSTRPTTGPSTTPTSSSPTAATTPTCPPLKGVIFSDAIESVMGVGVDMVRLPTG